MIFDHAERVEALLVLVLSFVNPLDDEGIGEHVARLFKGDLVTPTIARRFSVIPFEIIAFHIYGLPVEFKLSISFVRHAAPEPRHRRWLTPLSAPRSASARPHPSRPRSCGGGSRHPWRG